MAETRPISLGGRAFDVPPLPLGVTMLVYPICQRLTNAGLPERLNSGEPLQLSAEEIADLTETAFQVAHAADDTLDTKAFLALPVTPPELFEAFFVARFQCGGWRVAEGGDAPGEPQGAQPPTSTFAGSSPNSSDTSTSPPSIG